MPDGLVKAIVSDVQDPIPFPFPSIAKIGATVWTVSKSSLIWQIAINIHWTNIKKVLNELKKICPVVRK